MTRLSTRSLWPPTIRVLLWLSRGNVPLLMPLLMEVPMLLTVNSSLLNLTPMGRNELRPPGKPIHPTGRNELRPYRYEAANLGFTMGSRLWGRLRFVVG